MNESFAPTIRTKNNVEMKIWKKQNAITTTFTTVEMLFSHFILIAFFQATDNVVNNKMVFWMKKEPSKQEN